MSFNGFLHLRANNGDDFCKYLPPNKIIDFDSKTDHVSEVALLKDCRSKDDSVIFGEVIKNISFTIMG